MYKDSHVFASCLTLSIPDIFLSVPSVGDETRSRVTIHYIPCPIASILYCRRTKEIYDRIKFPCTIFLSSCTLVIFFIFVQCIFHALNVRATIKMKGESVVLRCELYNICVELRV